MAKRLQHSERIKQVEYRNHAVPGQETGVKAEHDLGDDHWSTVVPLHNTPLTSLLIMLLDLKLSENVPGSPWMSNHRRKPVRAFCSKKHRQAAIMTSDTTVAALIAEDNI